MPCNRVIARMAPADHLIHELTVVAYHCGASYEACRLCQTRRIVVEPWAEGYDVGWLYTGALSVTPVMLPDVEYEAEKVAA